MHEREQCATGLAHAAAALHQEFDERLSAPVVDACFAEVSGRFVDATVLAYVPLLVRRYAREDLLARLQTVDLRAPVPQPAVLAATE